MKSPNQMKSLFCCLSITVFLNISLNLQCSRKQSFAAIQYVKIDSATQLEVIDWGGSGAPVVFLAGLGHTAHVFDEFAPKLNDKFHVLGITRRGFGASSQPDTGYNITTLAEDIRTVIDSLALGQVVLIGHSLGGDEMTIFARRHPGIVKALVYIEAAYNRVTAKDSIARFTPPESEIPSPAEADKNSAEAYRNYYAKANGVTMPLSEIKAMYQWTAEGKLIGSTTPSWVYSRILESIRDPDYSQIEIPALAIYATDYPVTELFIDYYSRDSTTQHSMRIYHENAMRIDKLSREYFKAHMAGGRAVEISGAGHSLYITHSKETLDAISAFLDDVLR